MSLFLRERSYLLDQSQMLHPPAAGHVTSVHHVFTCGMCHTIYTWIHPLPTHSGGPAQWAAIEAGLSAVRGNSTPRRL